MDNGLPPIRLADLPGTRLRPWCRTPLGRDQGPPYRLMIARFPGGNAEHPASSGWVMAQLAAPPRHDLGAILPFRLSTTPITIARNRAVMEALDAGCHYLLMLDADMEPDLDPRSPPFLATAWSFLCRRRARERISVDIDDFDAWWAEFAPACVAAPYCGASPEHAVCMLDWRDGDHDADGRPRLRTIDRADAARRSGFGRVSAAGTGLILLDIRMFYYVPPPWFDYEYTDRFMTELASTEDVVFTRDATLLGMPCYAAWDSWAGHWKPELVVKPRPITSAVVAGRIAEAIAAGRNGETTLHFVHPDAERPCRSLDP